MVYNKGYEATEALQFYEDCADNLPYYQTSEKDNGFDWIDVEHIAVLENPIHIKGL